MPSTITQQTVDSLILNTTNIILAGILNSKQRNLFLLIYFRSHLLIMAPYRGNELVAVRWLPQKLSLLILDGADIEIITGVRCS